MREIDVQALQEEMQVGYWELVNGEDTVYRDSRGNVYDSWGCLERLRELEMMMEEGYGFAGAYLRDEAGVWILPDFREGSPHPERQDGGVSILQSDTGYLCPGGYRDGEDIRL